MLAETCVFDKQFRGLFCCGPLIYKDEDARVQKNIKFHVTYLRKNLLVIKKDLITHIVLYLTIQNERTHLHNYGAFIFRNYAFFNLLLLLSVLCKFLFKEEGADLIPKLRSLFCRVP